MREPRLGHYRLFRVLCCLLHFFKKPGWFQCSPPQQDRGKAEKRLCLRWVVGVTYASKNIIGTYIRFLVLSLYSKKYKKMYTGKLIRSFFRTFVEWKK